MSRTEISIPAYYKKLLLHHPSLFTFRERKELRLLLEKCLKAEKVSQSQVVVTLEEKLTVIDSILNEVGLGKAAVLSILFHDYIQRKHISINEVESNFATQISTITHGLTRVSELYERNTSLETENFRMLLLTSSVS